MVATFGKHLIECAVFLAESYSPVEPVSFCDVTLERGDVSIIHTHEVSYHPLRCSNMFIRWKLVSYLTPGDTPPHDNQGTERYRTLSLKALSALHQDTDLKK